MISFSRRTLLLAASAGAAFVSFFYLSIVLRDPLFLDRPWKWADYLELQSLFILASVLCAIFGTPFLYLIDKYCPKVSFRYVLGGAVAGWFMWFIIASPLFTPSQRFFAQHWYLNYDNWSLVYTSAGLYTGMVYSVALWSIEKWIKNRTKTAEAASLK